MSEEHVAALRGAQNPDESVAVLRLWLEDHAAAANPIASFRREAFSVARTLCREGVTARAVDLYTFAWNLDPSDIETGDPDDYALLHSREVQEYLKELSTTHVIVFVAGCARSGTSLIQRCLATLDQPIYYWSENSLAALWRQPRQDGKHIVLKRRSLCHAFTHTIPTTVRVVYAIRNPRFVLTSRVRGGKGPYVDADRWRAEYRAFQQVRESHPPENLSIVRYEDLLADPNQVQQRLAETLRLQFDRPFSRYQELDFLDEKIERHTGKKRRWEPIDPARPQSNRRDRDDTESLSQTLAALEPDIDQFCEEFGYSAVQDTWPRPSSRQ